jgi:N-acetylglucosaminyldiphosphoundecaprenol N-acetyl-beta-D-mannosaminyltransferase
MIPRVDVLGVGVSAINPGTAVAEVTRWVEESEQHYVCVTGVHGVMESQRDPELRAIHNHSGLTTPDGMPMVWAGRLAGARDVRRVYGPDLMLSVCERAAERGWRCFLYGGKEGVPEVLAERLTTLFPGLQIVGAYSPPFRPLSVSEDDQLIAQINAAKPDLVWVGLSTPKQERWMAEHLGRIQAPVMFGVGAAFDIHAGTLRQAPRWIQGLGMEWCFRLVMEPRRLWRRYLVNNPRFVVGVARRPPRLVSTEPGWQAALARSA